MRRILVGCAILALALSACELRAEISVNDDGSGTMGMVFGVEPEMLRLLTQAQPGADPFDDLRRDLANDPVAWKVASYHEGNLSGIRATFAFASVTDLRQKLEALNRDTDSDSAIEEFTLTRAGGGWSFSGTSSDVQSQVGGDEAPIPLEQLATLLKLQFRVTLPGKAGSNNADEVSSSGGKTTFIWKPSVKDRTVSFQARTSAGGKGLPVLPTALALGVLGAGAAIAILRGRPKGVPPGDAQSERATLEVAPVGGPPPSVPQHVESSP